MNRFLRIVKILIISIVSMIVLFILVLTIYFFYGHLYCHNDQRNEAYIKQFNDNKELFNEILNILKTEYLNDSIYFDEVVIEIIFKESNNGFAFDNEIVDYRIGDKLKGLGISRIKAWSNTFCKSDYEFDDVIFVIDANLCSPFSGRKSYRYDPCHSGFNAYKDNIEDYFLGDGWSFYVDKSFP